MLQVTLSSRVGPGIVRCGSAPNFSLHIRRGRLVIYIIYIAAAAAAHRSPRGWVPAPEPWFGPVQPLAHVTLERTQCDEMSQGVRRPSRHGQGTWESCWKGLCGWESYRIWDYVGQRVNMSLETWTGVKPNWVLAATCEMIWDEIEIIIKYLHLPTQSPSPVFARSSHSRA